MNIGYVGLGNMGGALARRLHLKHSLIVHDQDEAAVKRLVDNGARAAANRPAPPGRPGRPAAPGCAAAAGPAGAAAAAGARGSHPRRTRRGGRGHEPPDLPQPPGHGAWRLGPRPPPLRSDAT